MSDPFVPKGSKRPIGPQTCGYMLNASQSDYCGKPATWHVAWDSGLDNSLTCDGHMAVIQQRWVYDDRHPVCADCTMPGSLWLYERQRCEVLGGATLAAAELAVAR